MVQDTLPMDKQLMDIEMSELFAAEEDDFPSDFPLSYAEIVYRQKKDAKIKALLL